MRNGWNVVMIGDVCDVMTGGTPSRSRSEYFGGKIKWLVSGDIHRGEIVDCDERITEAGLRNSNAKYLPVNSVMMALNGQGKTRGTVAILRTKATCNQSLVGIYPKDLAKLQPEYIYAYLRGRYQDIRRITGDSGNDRRGLNMTLVRNIRIPIAPLDEQKRIVAILDESFAGIAAAVANTEKNLASAREVFESHLNAVFTQKGEGWVEKPLGDIVSFKHGFAFKSEFFADEGEFILLTPGNFFETGGYRARRDKQKFYIGEIPDGFVLHEGALLVAMTEQAAGLLGSPMIVPKANRFLHNQRLGLAEPKPGAPWCNAFFFHAFNTKRFRTKVHNDASGVKVRHTSPAKLCSVVVSFPVSEGEQKRVAARINAIATETQRLESCYRRKLEFLRELKQSFLHKAFAGELTAVAVEGRALQQAVV